KGEMKNAPYSSSFFNVDFTADIIHWDLRSDSMNIRTDGGRRIVPLIIESVDFYDIEDYRLLKGVFPFHPLAVVINYSLKYGLNEFYSGDLVVYSGRTPQEMRAAASFLSQKGLIDY